VNTIVILLPCHLIIHTTLKLLSPDTD